MNQIRRELLNGLLVLVVASLLSVAFSAFQVNFNAQFWVLILMAIAIAVSGYILFEITLGVITSAEDREKAFAESTRRREEEWLKRVGTPARMELNQDGETAGIAAIADAIRSVKAGSDYSAMFYFASEGGAESPPVKEVNAIRKRGFDALLEQRKSGALREYKRIICFDPDVLANDHELKSGVLRVPDDEDERVYVICRSRGSSLNRQFLWRG